MTEMSNEEMMDEMRRMAEANKKRRTVVGTVMENGGGATVGAGLGWLAGGVAAVALAPITGGLSILIPPAVAVVGGVVGHKASKGIDD